MHRCNYGSIPVSKWACTTPGPGILLTWMSFCEKDLLQSSNNTFLSHNYEQTCNFFWAPFPFREGVSVDFLQDGIEKI